MAKRGEMLISYFQNLLNVYLKTIRGDDNFTEEELEVKNDIIEIKEKGVKKKDEN